MEFAKERERHNREGLATSRAKKKASRELQNLACIINCEKSHSRESAGCSGKADCGSKGFEKGNL